MKALFASLLVVLGTAASLCLRAAPADADPFDQPDPFVRASAALARGDLAAAETLAAPLVAETPPRAEACTLLGEIRVGQKRQLEAIPYFEQAAQLSPKSAICRSRLGTALLQCAAEGDPAQRTALAARGLAALQRSLEIDPNHFDGCVALAHFYAETPAAQGGDFGQATAYAERMKKLNPFEGTLMLGIIAERQGKPDLALERYRETTRMWDGDPDLCGCEARVLARLGRVSEARACYQAILERFPQWEAGRQALAGLPAPAPAGAK